VDARLIKANIALFNESRAETRRWLKEYLADETNEHERDTYAPLVMWLDAQTRANREDRIERLRALIHSTEPDNVYASMASQYLADEERYAAKLKGAGRDERTGIQFFGVGLWKIVLFALVVSIASYGASRLLNANASQDTDSSGAQVVFDSGNPVSTLPDHSKPLEEGRYTVQYPQGNFAVTALEDASERVVDLDEMALLNPVPGARFYALNVLFECRTGICGTPPEAKLALRLDGGVVIGSSANVGIAGETLLQPIAQGRSTEGWVVFEIPLASNVQGLVITPKSDDQQAEPLHIALPTP
jgi:hypothetical protein